MNSISIFVSSCLSGYIVCQLDYRPYITTSIPVLVQLITVHTSLFVTYHVVAKELLLLVIVRILTKVLHFEYMRTRVLINIISIETA
jgi:hypothetical protein